MQINCKNEEKIKLIKELPEIYLKPELKQYCDNRKICPFNSGGMIDSSVGTNLKVIVFHRFEMSCHSLFERQSVHVLQDILNSQVPLRQDDTPESESVSRWCWVPSQDILGKHNAFLLGLTTLLCGEALQDTIGKQSESQPTQSLKKSSYLQ
jgi:hypothetical protein